MQTTTRPATMAEAARIVMARDPEIDHVQLQQILKKEFHMQMKNKLAYNYRKTALEKINHPSRPERDNGAPAKAAPKSQLEELVRLGNEMGWERVREVAEIAMLVKK